MKQFLLFGFVFLYSNTLFGQTFTLGIQSSVGTSCGACPSSCDPTYCSGAPISGNCSPVVTVNSAYYSVPAGSRVQVSIASNICETNSGLDNEDNIKINGTTIVTGSSNMNVNYNGCFYNSSSNSINTNISLTANRRSETITVTLTITPGDNGCMPLPGTLPLTLEEFTATTLKEKVRLFWKTSNEINVDHTIIEYSIDGINFNKLDIISNEANKNIFEYYFENPRNNTYYFRLKFVDKDGSFSFSNITSASYSSNKKYVINSLVTSSLDVDFNTIEPPIVNILNSNGIIVKPNLECKKGKNSINVEDLPSGLYFIQIKSSEANITIEKFVKN